MRVLILKRHARQRPEGGREIDPTCWSMFDAIVFRPRPLTEDGAFFSPATGLLNGRLGYRFDNGWRNCRTPRVVAVKSLAGVDAARAAGRWRPKRKGLIVATVGAYSENGNIGPAINPRRVRLVARRR